MIGLCILGLAALATFAAARCTVGSGLMVLLTLGYFYGLIRAQYLDTFTHLSFDASVLAFYAGMFSRPPGPQAAAAGRTVRGWLQLLMGWPLLLFLLPFHHPLVQLVGLRHVILFLPFLAVGTRLTPADLERLARCLAVLNLLAFGFALYEYAYGLEALFPLNATTEILYRSRDVATAEGIFHRLPATFTSAHAYGNVMVITLPFLVNGLINPRKDLGERWLLGLACLATLLGVFLAGARSPAVQAVLGLVLLLFVPGLPRGIREGLWVVVLGLAAVCAYAVLQDERLQRFANLLDAEYVEKRVGGSVQFGVLAALWEYPIGAGLGSAFGSSMPHFLADVAPTPIGAESEFARIAIEQGAVGCLLWAGFLGTVFLRQARPLSPAWAVGTAHLKIQVLLLWATGLLGTGLLQAIPASPLMLLAMGLLLRDVPRGPR